MTVTIRSTLNRIILLFIAAGLILGLVHSAVCKESYDPVSELSEYRNEMAAPALPGMSDLVADSSASADMTRFLAEKGEAGRHLINDFDNTGWTGFKNCGIFSFNLCVFLLCVLSGTSFKHIFYIHLKDGNK